MTQIFDRYLYEQYYGQSTVYDQLKQVKFEEEQAETLSNLFSQFTENDPSSKSDLSETELRLQKEIRELDARMKDTEKNHRNCFWIKSENSQMGRRDAVSEYQFETPSQQDFEIGPDYSGKIIDVTAVRAIGKIAMASFIKLFL